MRYLSIFHVNMLMESRFLFFRTLFLVYLGWLSVATIVEISILLKANGLINLFGLPEMFWAILF